MKTPGHLLFQYRARLGLVRRGEKGEQEADCDRLHARRLQLPHGDAQPGLVQRRLHAAIGQHALAHLQPFVPAGQDRRLAGSQVVELRPLLPADLQHVAEPGGGQQ